MRWVLVNNVDWKVMAEEQYEAIQRASLQNKQYEWWKDDQSYLDIDKP